MVPHIESYTDSPLFEGLSEDEIEVILQATNSCWFEKNDIIFREGDTSKSLFLMEEGSVSVLKNINNLDTMIARLEAKSVFGEMALTLDVPRTATIKALERVHVRELLYDDFRALVGIHCMAASKISFNIAKLLTGRINHMLHELDSIASSNNESTEVKTELNIFRQQVFSDWRY